VSRATAFWADLERPERRALLMMMAVVVGGLHIAGFAMLLGLSAPALTVGIGVTAYTLGLRHAFDADHIAAIDNTTRKLISEGKRPLSVGFWFSLGHSTIVILAGIIRVFREMKSGHFDEAALEQQLDQRGLMNRFLGRLTKGVSKPGHMYPIGVLFGLGLDTVDLNVVGFVLVGMFLVTWAVAVTVWRFGHIEERWSAHLQETR
jgi:nickel/cobalt transporter (NiCoT) family protein